MFSSAAKEKIIQYLNEDKKLHCFFEERSNFSNKVLVGMITIPPNK